LTKEERNIAMKKQYKTPITESVKVNLYGSVLGGIGVEGGSPVTPIADAKEQGDFFDFEDDDTFGDIWGTDEDPNDLWGE
jgi:hypothetical protein